jgi:hypothetical protein
MLARNPHHFTRLPNEREIASIPLSLGVEFELSEKEMKQLRQELYKINHDGIRRYRTVRVDRLLLVWRIK